MSQNQYFCVLDVDAVVRNYLKGGSSSEFSIKDVAERLEEKDKDGFFEDFTEEDIISLSWIAATAVAKRKRGFFSKHGRKPSADEVKYEFTLMISAIKEHDEIERNVKESFSNLSSLPESEQLDIYSSFYDEKLVRTDKKIGDFMPKPDKSNLKVWSGFMESCRIDKAGHLVFTFPDGSRKVANHMAIILTEEMLMAYRSLV